MYGIEYNFPNLWPGKSLIYDQTIHFLNIIFSWAEIFYFGEIQPIDFLSFFKNPYLWGFWWAFLVAQMVKHLPAMWATQIWSLGQEDPLEEKVATHPGIHAWKIPWAKEPGGLQSMGSQRVRHDWATSLHEVLLGLPGGSMVKNLPAKLETWVRSLGKEDSLEKEMATHSNIFAVKVPWTEELGRLQSIGSQRVGHDCCCC